MALGAGGTGKGAVGAVRGAAGVLKDLERRQKSRATRTERDALDRALVDLAGFYRDVLAREPAARTAPLLNPDIPDQVNAVAARLGPDGALTGSTRCWPVGRRSKLNVKPQIAVESMVMALFAGSHRRTTV